MRMSTTKGLALVVATTLVGCGFSPENKGESWSRDGKWR